MDAIATEAATMPNSIGLSLANRDGETLKFADHYNLKQKLAKGSYGTVFVVEHKATKRDYAVKVIERSRLSAKDKDLVEREVSIMKDCRDVESIVKLIDYFVEKDTFYVVQVFAEGGKQKINRSVVGSTHRPKTQSVLCRFLYRKGDVFERLAEMTTYNEKNARDLAVQLIKAMEVLHERKIAHRGTSGLSYTKFAEAYVRLPYSQTPPNVVRLETRKPSFAQ